MEEYNRIDMIALIGIILAVAYILWRQVWVYGEVLRLLGRYRHLMSYRWIAQREGEDDEEDERGYYDEDTPTLVDVQSGALSQESKEVLHAINGYLVANQRATPSFELVRDIVERHSGGLEERIRALQPQPLYLGLSGTILGILLGLLPMALGSGAGLEQIPELLLGIALAMVGSFVGILCTVLIAGKFKEAQTQALEDKNHFYDWFLQTMLPAISSRSASDFLALADALGNFNKDFSHNAKQMKEATASTAQMLEVQQKLLAKVQELSMGDIPRKNIEMAERLARNVDVIAELTKHLQGSHEYIKKVEELVGALRSSNRYIEVVERLSELLASSENSIQTTNNRMQQVANEAVESLRETLRKQNEHLSATLSKENVLAPLKDLASLPDEVGSVATSLAGVNEVLSQLEKRLIGLEQLSGLGHSIQELRGELRHGVGVELRAVAQVPDRVFEQMTAKDVLQALLRLNKK